MTKADKFSRFSNTDSVRQNLTRKSVRGVFFMIGGSGADIVVRLVSTFWLARLLSPSDFGLLAMIVSITAIAEQFSELGLSTATIQSRELSHQQVTNLFWINVGAGCLFSLAISGLAPAIASFYGTPELVTMTVLISTTFICGGLTVQHQALLSRQLKQSHMALIRVSASFLSLVLAVLLAAYHFGAWALVWREVSRALFVVLGMWLFCPWVPGWPRRDAGTKSLLHYGSHLTLSQLVTACVAQLDRLLIGRFFGADPLGLYRQAQQLIITPIDQLRMPLYSVASPSLSILQSDPYRYRRYYQRIVFVISLATMPAGFFIAIYAEEITHVLLGPKWIAATVFLRIFGLVAAMKPSLDTTAVVMLTTGMSKRLLTLTTAYYGLFAAFIFGGLYWGPVGVAISNVVGIVVLMFPMLYFSLRGSPVTVSAFLSAISVPAIAATVMAGVLLLTRNFVSHYGMTVSLSIGIIAAGLTYALMVVVQAGGRSEVGSLFAAVLRSFQKQRAHAMVEPETENVSVS
jgi:O-antigen/teichoic acid export membrane protein